MARADLLAHRRRAGEGDLVDVRVRDQGHARSRPGPVTMLTTPGGRSAWRQTSAKSRAVSGVVVAGLRTTVLPAARAGAIFQASMRSGKFQGMTWAATPSGWADAARERVVELVGPAGVVPEVGRRERDVDVARLLDRLAASPCVSSTANSRLRSWRMRAMRKRYLARSRARQRGPSAGAGRAAPRRRPCPRPRRWPGRSPPAAPRSPGRGREPLAARSARPPGRR